MPLQVWLLNPFKIVYPWPELRLLVEGFMRPVVAERDKAHKHKLVSVMALSRYTKPSVGAHDLACYVVPVKNFGFGGVHFGKELGGRPDSGGLTVHKGKQVCSEVYLGEEIVQSSVAKFISVERMTNPEKGVYVKERWEPSYVARLIYHELLHNVTPQWSEETLHGKKGVSIGKEGPARSAPQSGKDIEILATHMDTAGNTQWTGGFDV